MAFKYKTQERLKKIMDRQMPDRFGHEYIPATLATREEAPKVSNAYQDYSLMLGRDVHVLSPAERQAKDLITYHPHFIDLLEQRMLSVIPRPHPFAAHPVMSGVRLDSLDGTLRVAERLGSMCLHSSIYVVQKNGSKKKVPFPYQGDLLFLLHDQEGPYAMNWSVKTRQRDFGVPFRGENRFKYPLRAARRASFRDELERVYYSDAKIRTVSFSPECIDQKLAGNLRRLCSWHTRPCLTGNYATDAIEEYRRSIPKGIPPFETRDKLMRKYGGDRDRHTATLWRAIWTRQLHVNMFVTLVIDKPFSPQKRDVIDVYGSLFRRTSA